MLFVVTITGIQLGGRLVSVAHKMETEQSPNLTLCGWLNPPHLSLMPKGAENVVSVLIFFFLIWESVFIFIFCTWSLRYKTTSDFLVFPAYLTHLSDIAAASWLLGCTNMDLQCQMWQWLEVSQFIKLTLNWLHAFMQWLALSLLSKKVLVRIFPRAFLGADEFQRALSCDPQVITTHYDSIICRSWVIWQRHSKDHRHHINTCMCTIYFFWTAQINMQDYYFSKWNVG